MSKFRALLVSAGSLLVGCVAARAATVETDSIRQFRVGLSTIEDVTAEFGVASPSRVDAGEESDRAICYRLADSREPPTLWVYSNALGGFQTVTGFRVSNRVDSGTCEWGTRKSREILSLGTVKGIVLGMSKKRFLSRFSFVLAETGDEVKFVETKQSPPPGMLASSNGHATIDRDEWSVTTRISAHFSNEALDDYKFEQFWSN